VFGVKYIFDNNTVNLTCCGATLPYASQEPGAPSAPIKAVGQHSLQHSALTKMRGS